MRVGDNLDSDHQPSRVNIERGRGEVENGGEKEEILKRGMG